MSEKSITTIEPFAQLPEDDLAKLGSLGTFEVTPLAGSVGGDGATLPTEGVNLNTLNASSDFFNVDATLNTVSGNFCTPRGCSC